jgi:predicted HTH transcriptional regulator
MADGAPQCVPFYPHEFIQRQADLGLMDYSSLPVAGATVNDLDPLERERLRQMVERFGGDRSLLSLKDEELDGALGLTRHENGQRLPTVAGLLILGREAVLREHLPTHEVAFQRLTPMIGVSTARNIIMSSWNDLFCYRAQCCIEKDSSRMTCYLENVGRHKGPCE